MSLQQILAQIGEALLNVGEIVPKILGALLLVVSGWVLARILRNWARRLSTAMFVRMGGDIAGSQHPSTAGLLIGTIVFWVVFLIFVAAGVETLGLPVVTATLSRIVYFLPNVLAAGIVFIVGIVAGDLARQAVTRAFTIAGAEQAAMLGSIARLATIGVALIVAIEEVGIDGQLLVLLAAIVVGAGLAGAGLAFGLGARTAVSNIIASHYLPDGYREGRLVRIGDIEGRIVATTPATVVVATPDAQVTIPAKHFGEQVSFLLTETS